MGRFINADTFTTTGQGLLGNNMFAYCNNNPVMSGDPTGQLLADWDVFPNQQAGKMFTEWYINADENEMDGYGNLTLNAKLKRTVSAVGSSFEVVAGIGHGLYGGFEFSEYIGAEVGIYHDLIRVEYIDGQFSAYQYAFQGVSANLIIGSLGETIEMYCPTASYSNKWEYYESNEKMSLYGGGGYFFVGGTFAINWDIIGLLNDIDNIWG